MTADPSVAPAAPCSLAAALARPAVRLFLTSFAVLFVELLLIRWIPAYAVFVGFFSNFILMSSFLGIGLGILLGPRLERLSAIWLSVVLLAPVFFANLVFSRSFGETGQADVAFASNLLGAMVGGALEYLSLLTGFRTLGLVALGLYGLAWLFERQIRLLGDRVTVRPASHEGAAAESA